MVNTPINNTASSGSPPVQRLPPKSLVPESLSTAPTQHVVPNVAQERAASADAAQVKHAAEKIAQTVQSLASNLQFSVDEDTGRMVVRVVDRETREVIRQIPSEELLAIAESLDKLQGLLIHEEA